MKELLEALNNACQNEVTFIQIGSNEGVMSNDPLCPFILNYPWKGVLIEPVPRLFEKLKDNYSGRPNLYFEMVAISDTRKTCTFYTIDVNAELFRNNQKLINEYGQVWGEQLGSFNKEHILDPRKYGRLHSELSKLSDKELHVLSVECVPVDEIADKYNLSAADLLHIDTEGHDDTILASLDFKKIKPKMIIFEHMHMTFERYCLCITHLKIHDYSVVYTSGIDTVVCLRDWSKVAKIDKTSRI